jgi:hypothetical protein
VRDQRKARPIVWANGHAAIWRASGLVDVVEAPPIDGERPRPIGLTGQIPAADVPLDLSAQLRRRSLIDYR